MAEGVGFEPTLGFPLSLISSQVPSTTQPPFHLRGKNAFFPPANLAFPYFFFYTVRMKSSKKQQEPSQWQTTPVVNLVRNLASGRDYARARVAGKLI
jgi:hypothetical protein